MTQIVTTPDGTQHEFPDGATPEQITAALKGLSADRSAALVPGGMGPQEAERVTAAYRRGATHGLMDAPTALAQTFAHLVGTLAPSGSSLESWAKERSKALEQYAAVQEAKSRNAGPGAETGRIVGNLAVQLPLSLTPIGGATLPARLAAATAQGAVAGGLQPVEEGKDFWSEKGKQVGIGAGAGLVSGGAAEGIARVIAPKAASDPNVQRLMQAGVRPTPGQIMGGGIKRAEEKLASVPVLGSAIKTGQERAVTQFNRAAIDETLAPIGAKLPADKTGREAIEWAGEKISDGYNAVVPQLSARIDSQFAMDFINLMSLSRNMVPDRMRQFDKIIADKVVHHMSRNGTFTGEALKQIESELGRNAAQFGRSFDADHRLLADAFREAQRAFRSLVERAHPNSGLQELNAAYSKFLRVENAAGRIGAHEGVFSPAQLKGAVRQMDPSLRHRAFARGNAPMQDLAEAGTAVLANRVPNSGTVDRLLAALAYGGPVAAGAAGAQFIDPRMAAIAAPALLYTRPGQSALAHLLATRPAGAQPLAEAIRGFGRPLGSGLLATGGGGILGP